VDITRTVVWLPTGTCAEDGVKTMGGCVGAAVGDAAGAAETLGKGEGT